MFDYIIVGAGFAGSVLAERLATVMDKKVLLVEKRRHIAGNAFDYFNDEGILVHKYGPHIFHTNSSEIFKYLSNFTQWRNYQHRVLASVDGQYFPIPINLTTVNNLYGYQLNSTELEDFFKNVAEPVDRITTSEEVVTSKVGRDLYEKFFKTYTQKQWGLDPSELQASVAARVPARLNKDDRYFTDKYQCMPLLGYSRLFEKMLDHRNIKVLLNTDYKEIINHIKHHNLIFTGPIDEFFNYRFGRLPYRSIEFKFETLDIPCFQQTGTINYPNDYDFTRISEFKYLTGQHHEKTTIVYEFPRADGDPYYPIPKQESLELYNKYKYLATQLSNVYFVGRLGTYQYYNMDQVVAQALNLFKKLLDKEASI